MLRRAAKGRTLPVLAVLLAIVAIWYAGAVGLNAQWVRDQAARSETVLSTGEFVVRTLSLDRPVLPAPHQVAAGLWDGIAGQKITSKRSLVWHGWVTLSATLAGFAIGTAAGILLAVGIVHNRAMDQSVMPWAVASQTVPILAIAPMVIVVLASAGITGLLPKAVIAAWLSFFPVLVGMVKGLRTPDAMQLDLMKSWSASPSQIFWRLRLPSSMPYLFASLKVGVAAALVGTIVGELPAGASSGLGARLLSGSYYGQTVQIWSALFAAAALAAGLVIAIGAVEKIALRRMGLAR
ncbi:MAG: ABC transporter permease [Paracoccus sp. (in: a-proteobacteria)]|uniref:ABC transporter permease n=1 Tax=unclassified Paracoccus (in: a-proteobacteria) TaxID=2688777 RepID=UPI000C68EAE0|nr:MULTISPECIES: ABC transporter permease [unclassified Paracoccus (in: a-proteobacteria)]MAN56411.1 ABC transporter permease [Paracoccus sp. (in: a-proteobacteria)]MAN57276.1 ABC transporter permease [Paracoccus sp. (in: a-proteobacteria)]MBA48876.1 ABC transporter permease [Paracoccus sp. (in: a-proteobacteria)]MCS5600611.1 ABC transporter permease [Paracoccus sp. (in: a-proteobacteria)]MDB2551490.1 ABC transporter permease [Paracoccus sp. (in: a-proteobacteria)]